MRPAIVATIAASCLVMCGCKGKLPTVLTVSRTIPAPAALGRYLPGESVPDFPGNVVFGSVPKPAEHPKTVYVVSRLPDDGIPTFFNHYRLYPSIHWIVYGTETELKPAAKYVEDLVKKGESPEGLTLMTYDKSVGGITAIPSALGNYSLIRNGIVVAQCFEPGLDHMAIKVLEGKVDTAEQYKLLMANVHMWSNYLTYQNQLHDLAVKGATFAELKKASMAAFPKIQGAEARGSYAALFLTYAGFRPLDQVKDFLKMVRPDDVLGERFSGNIRYLSGHDECRERSLAELEVAYRSPETADSPAILRSLARSAIDLGQKRRAQSLLKQMMACKSLQPRYAKRLKDSFEQDYDDLMWHATH